jgi:16S rRNA processing protein RimM
MLAESDMADRSRDRRASPQLSRAQSRNDRDSARICLGIVTGVHGIKGWVRVKSFTAEPEAIAAYGPLEDESGARRFAIDLVGAGKGVLLARLAGIEDRAAAERLKGLRLYVQRAVLPPPEEGEFYAADLIGLSALLEDGTRFGTVRAVNDFGAGASLEIEDTAGKTVVVPFTGAAVPVVDVAGQRVVVVPPAGLLDAPARAADDTDTDER